MRLDFSLTGKDKNIIFYVVLGIVLFISILVRLIIYFKVKIFPPTTDALYHSLITKMILDQKTIFIFWDFGKPVSYPPAFATFSALIAAIFDIPSFRGVWNFVMILVILQIFAAYLLGKELGGRSIGLASAFFFGMGLFPWTPFLLAGMYANILGQTVMLFLLYFVVRWRLSNKKYIFISGLLLALLIMSHAISLMSFLIAFISLNAFLIYKKEGMKIRNMIAFLVLGIIFALPWLIHVYPSLALKIPKPSEFVVGPTEGIEMIYYRYGILPIFFIIALYPIFKGRNKGFVILIWVLSLYISSFLMWKNRFGMELYVPLNFIAAYGLVFVSEKGLGLLKRRNPVSILFLILFFYTLIFTTDNILLQPKYFQTFEVDEYNLEAMNWIKDNTEEDEIFYASTVSSYIGYIYVYSGMEVINYTIRSSAEGLIALPGTEEEEKDEFREIEKPENFGGELFYSTLLKYNVTYIYLFHKGGVTEWRNTKTGERTFITKDQILSERPDFYEVVYENKYVKIYKIKNIYGTTTTSS